MSVVALKPANDVEDKVITIRVTEDGVRYSTKGFDSYIEELGAVHVAADMILACTREDEDG